MTLPGERAAAASGGAEGSVHVFDLDETVLTVNSFPLWVRHLLKGPLPGISWPLRAWLSLATGLALADRKLRRRPHALFKARLQRIWAAIPPQAAGAAVAPLIGRLLRRRRPELASMLARVETGTIEAVLATAAVAEYADDLAAALGFRTVLATARGRAATEENVRAAKRRSVVDLLERSGWAMREIVVYTDHLEDLPLIGLASRLVWCGSGPDLATVRRQLPDLPVIWIGDATAGDIEAFALQG